MSHGSLLNFDLFDSIDTERRKFSQDQRNFKGIYLVLFGAGGSNPCAAYTKKSPFKQRRIVIDQTLYWDCVETEDEDEALYLVGLINSRRINEMISEFQPKGLKGGRHIHTLPLQAIPHFNKNDDIHQTTSNSTKLLIQAWDKLLRTDQDLELHLNPNNSLPHRRRAINNLVEGLNEFNAYNDAVKAIL